jgi:hypothetical protein
MKDDSFMCRYFEVTEWTSSKPQRVVAISGLKGSGKDSAAQALLDRGYHHAKFAGTLKSMVRQILLDSGISLAEIFSWIEGDKKEVPCPALGGKSVREATKSLGNDWGRDMISRTLWVDIVRMQIASLDTDVVITDLRYENELAMLKDVGAITVRVERPGVKVDDHPSETSVMSLAVDHVIVNDGTIQELQDKLSTIIDSYDVQ